MGASHKIDTKRKVKNGSRRSNHVCGISTCSGKGKNGALQTYAKFGLIISWFHAHRYGNRLHRPLRVGETGCQAGGWHILSGWRQFRAAKRTVKKWL